MTNLLLGATGFMGGHLVEYLFKQGEISRGTFRAGSHLKILDSSGVQGVEADLLDHHSLHEALEGVEEEGARTLEEMRAMVAALRDGGAGAELAPPAGVADLERLARAPGGGLRVDLQLDGELDALPPAVDAAVYRVVQESVTNAMRHAVDATEVVVRVTGEPQRVRVTVQDDGARVGRGRNGYGLAGLRERAALLGGQLRAGPGADRGWRVEAELPRGRAGSRVHPRPRR